MASELPPSPSSSPTRAAGAPSPALPTGRDDVPPSHVTTTTTTTAAAPPAIPPRPQSPPNQMTDPVAALQAAFPSMDRTIITEVLAAHGGNPDSASMALLEISGTTPTSPTNPRNATTGNNNEHTKNAQMLADEAYARELMAQMEREHMQEYGRPIDSRQPQPQQAQEIDYNQLNYTPRQQRNRFGQPVGRGQAQPQQQGQGQEEDGRWKHQDELDQLTEQFGKFADTGKKTLNSLFSKAKDKYAQVQQQQREYAQQQREGVPSGSTSSNAGTGTAPTTIAGFTIPSIPAPWQGGFGSKAGIVGHTSNQRPASPRDTVRAGAMSPDNSARETVMKDYSASSPLRDGRPRYESRTSLDDDAPPIQIKRPSSSSASMSIPKSSSSTTAPTLSSSPATSAPGFSTSPAGNPTSSTRGFGSSPAKVQMLPRQTINLLEETGPDSKERERSRSGSPGLTTNAGTTGATAASASTGMSSDRRDDDDSDNESVEYVKNPFNDDD